MLLSASSFDKENSPCLNQEYENETNNSAFVQVTSRKLRSIIKNNNNKSVHTDDKHFQMAPGTVHMTSQRDGNRSQGKVVLSLLPDDPKSTFKHMPRAPSTDKKKPAKDGNLLRRQRRVSFESSPPTTLTPGDTAKVKDALETKNKILPGKSNGISDSEQNVLDSRVNVKSKGTLLDKVDPETVDTPDSGLDPGLITREGTFTLSDSGEKSWNEDNVDGRETEREGSKSASSHCSTCTCAEPTSGSLTRPMNSETHGNITDDVGKTGVTSKTPSSMRPISRSAKTRIPQLTEERRKVNSAKSRRVSHEGTVKLREISPARSVGSEENKKSVLKRINKQSAWEDMEDELAERTPDNRLEPLRKPSAVRIKPESYAISLNGRRGLSLEADPCPSCSQVHGKTSLQVDGEAERLPHPAELLLKIKRKHLRKRNLTDSVASYVKECTAEGGATTSMDSNGIISHRRAVTDTTHLEKLKENVTLSLKRCTLTSANARMLSEDQTTSAITTVAQQMQSPAVIGAKSDKLAALAQGEFRDEKEEGLLNKTYTLTNYNQFVQMAKIHKPDTQSEPKQYSKPLLNKRQVLALDLSKFENEGLAIQLNSNDLGNKLNDESVNDDTAVKKTLDTSMANSIADIPKCNRLPPISPVSKKAPIKVRVRVTPRSRSKKQGHLKEYDIKSIKRVEDLPPLVREELKNKARLRLKQLSSPIQSNDIETERNH